MTDLSIRTENLTRDFHSIRAVNDLSLCVPTGIVFGFLGPNGAGKTTTIRLLLGLLEPTSGQAEVLGLDVRTQAGRIRACVGTILEGDGLYERLTAYENLDLFAEINHLNKSERNTRIRQLMEHLNLWGRQSEKAGKFSTGMKKKLALARALIHRPALFFLDEPTAGLDAHSAVTLREDFKTLAQQEGVTVFLTTHNLAEAEKICDRVAVIHKGQLLAEGRPDEIGAKIQHPSVKVSGSGFKPRVHTELERLAHVVSVASCEDGVIIQVEEGGRISDFINLLVSSGVQVEEVNKINTTLEDAFVALTKEGPR